MARRGELGGFRAAWLRCHGLSVGSETRGPFSRVPRAASSLRMQSEEPVVASYGPRGHCDHAATPRGDAHVRTKCAASTVIVRAASVRPWRKPLEGSTWA